ncbi:hypothetical protein IV102_35115 [bacterium]|nr:hypothetical protein [bacterium]
MLLLSVNTAGILANQNIFDCATSADANLVGYQSLSINLSTPVGNGQAHIYVRNISAGTTRLVSTDVAGAQGNGQSGGCWLSGDGAFIAFYSDATNLVAGDTNGVADVFLKNLNTGSIQRVSVDSSGVQGNGQSPHFADPETGDVILSRKPANWDREPLDETVPSG